MSSAEEFNFLTLFKQAAREVVGKPFDDITYDSSIAEFGIDSISTTEIVARIEDELNIRISDDALVQLRTVRDLADAVEEERRRTKR